MGREHLVLHNLEPETHLVANLPLKWQKRFKLALASMEKMIYEDESFTWEEIAKHSAISAHHFHRMFALVFNETPGQYLSRKRLQIAVTLIVSEPGLTVTDIAHESGFSSSQALAKALKRTLGLSAKDIKSRHKITRVFEELMRTLGQPMALAQQSLEENMAQSIPFDIAYYDQRCLVTRGLKNSSFWEMERTWLEMKPRGEQIAMVNLMKMDFSGENLEVNGLEVGYFCDNSQLVTQSLAEGNYLCGRICVNSLNAYFAAWDALFLYALAHDLTPDEQGKCIEIVEQPETGVNIRYRYVDKH